MIIENNALWSLPHISTFATAAEVNALCWSSCKKNKKTIYLGKNPKSKRQMVNISSEALTLTTD